MSDTQTTTTPPTSIDAAAPAEAPAAAPAAAAAVPDYLTTLLEQIAVREGFAPGYTIDTATGSNAGDGFQALMLRTCIRGQRSSGSDQPLQLICKIPPANELRRQLCASSFKQEVFAYETMLPHLRQLQIDRQIAPEDGFYSYPRCYGTFSAPETNEYAIVLEDLNHSGCRMWNKLDEIDWAHVRLIVQQMGRYHALSFALRDQQPERLREFADRPSGMFKAMTDFPPAHDFYMKAFNRALEVFDETDEVEARAKVKFALLRDTYREVMERVTDGARAEPFTVLNHGDCWNNNMMFRYAGDEAGEGDKVQSVVVIDWQMGQYCSPATDLAYFIFTSTEQPVRDAHFADMLHEYYASLSGLLRKLGSDPDKLFTFADLERELSESAIYSMVMVPMLVQLVTVDPKDIPDLDTLDLENADAFEFMAESTAKYTKRMRDVVRDFAERGYFDTKLLK